MNRNYFLALIFIATCCILLIFVSMWREANKDIPLKQHSTHPVSPFKSSIAAVGIVESGSENIFIGSPVNRLVEKVMVTVGMNVKKGEPLLRLENRDLEADLMLQKVAYEIAQAKVAKLEAPPRPEDISSAKAALTGAQAELVQAKNQYDMAQALGDSRAISQEEVNRRLSNYQQAEAKWQQTKANLDKIKAGTWEPDLEIARLEALQAKANIERAQTEIQRTTIQSPINGKVLQIKIHEGELPPLDTSKNPLMIIGDVTDKLLKVSINQFNAPYYQPQAPAVAFLQGDARMEFPIEFVRIEPYLVNKQNLTNEITEKVDTRVLHVIYRFKKDDPSIFIGQQMDVFIESEHGH